MQVGFRPPASLICAALLLALLLVGKARLERPVVTGPLAAPDQVHLSIVGDPATSIGVTWRSASGSAGPYLVEYGSASGRYPGGSAQAASEPAPGNRGFLHKVELTGLQPDQAYVYRVSGDHGAWSQSYSFRTAPTELPPHGLVFTFNADLGTSRRYPDVGSVLRQLATEQAALHLIGGDITYADEENGTQTEEDFFATDLPVVATSRPVMPAWGNHEYDRSRDSSIRTITSYFQLPRTRLATCNNPVASYSFVYAGVFFVALDDPDSDCFDYDDQRRWLRRSLAEAIANPTVRWKVVFLHQPPFSGGANKNQSRLQFREYDQFDVDLVLAGHNHEYERTWPLNWNGDRVVYSYDAPGLPTYLIAGTGGAPTSTKRSAVNPWSAYRDEGQHVGYVRLTATEHSLTGELVAEPIDRRTDYQVRDSFTIRR